MISKVLRFKYLTALKKYSTNKIPTFGVILLFMVSSLSVAYPQPQMIIENQDRAITGDGVLNFNQSGGAYAYTIFGEGPDANDGVSADVYNTVKSPAPMSSYIPAWFDDNLPDISNNPSAGTDDSRDTTYLSIVPASQIVGFNETFSIIVHLDPGEPIIGVQIDLSFNASLIQVVSVAKADPIWFFFQPNINNTEGEIHGAAVVVFGYNVTTPIDCFQITFISDSIEGVSPLILHDVIVTDENAQPISVVITNGEVIVEGPENLPPVFGTPSPANGSTGQPLSLTWSIPINDPNGNTFSWWIQCSNGQQSSGSGASNGSKSLSLTGLAYGTTYKVWVNATDPSPGSGLYTRRWYVFTTIPLMNLPPVFGSPSPANGSTGQPLSLTWSIPISDPNGDVFSWSIQCSNGQVSSGSGASNGTKSLALSGLVHSTMYTVWVNATDPSPGSGLYTRRWYRFTTLAQNHPPYAPSNPDPANGAIEVPINSDLYWTGGDQDTGDTVAYDVYFGTTNPPLTKIKTNTSGTSCALESLNYSTKYYWKVVAWDNHQNTNTSPVWSFTTKLDTSGPSLSITSPKKGWMYIHLLGGVIHKTLPILITTIVIGSIDVNVTASDSQSGIDRVEFYVDNTLMATDYTKPYSWTWGYATFFPYTLTVKAYDKLNNPSTSPGLRVWKFL